VVVILKDDPVGYRNCLNPTTIYPCSFDRNFGSWKKEESQSYSIIRILNTASLGATTTAMQYHACLVEFDMCVDFKTSDPSITTADAELTITKEQFSAACMKDAFKVVTMPQ
jgi:hypothetical protein